MTDSTLAPRLFTASNILLQTMVDAGITHCFVNLGSDHPSLLEAFIQREKDGKKSPKIVTSPNEVSSERPTPHCSSASAQLGADP